MSGHQEKAARLAFCENGDSEITGLTKAILMMLSRTPLATGRSKGAAGTRAIHVTSLNKQQRGHISKCYLGACRKEAWYDQGTTD